MNRDMTTKPTKRRLVKRRLVKRRLVFSNLLNNAMRFTPHGGKIWAESAGPGKGAAFKVILPRYPEEQP